LPIIKKTKKKKIRGGKKRDWKAARQKKNAGTGGGRFEVRQGYFISNKKEGEKEPGDQGETKHEPSREENPVNRPKATRKTNGTQTQPFHSTTCPTINTAGSGAEGE